MLTKGGESFFDDNGAYDGSKSNMIGATVKIDEDVSLVDRCCRGFGASEGNDLEKKNGENGK